jgi:hypothetical protein
MQHRVGTNGATFYITGVQLEVGSSATGYEYENYTSLLSKCQRYYLTSNGSDFVCDAASYASYQYKVSMRVSPTLTVTPAGGSWFTGGNNLTGFYGTNTVLSTIPFNATAEL